ncbi:hypothetical protein [Paracoccus sp. (in: a-proteobacteria)]|uniref:hypothetical protein n=1 Tax=Paracoccus sp. TaxID=267 RepID=UPI0028A6EEC8|nr:hypothetical protein [Paracoccus sp. (in: a-proteobacteria)]
MVYHCPVGLLGRSLGQKKDRGEQRRRAKAKGGEEIAQRAVVQPVISGLEPLPARAQGRWEAARADRLTHFNGGSRSAEISAVLTCALHLVTVRTAPTIGSANNRMEGFVMSLPLDYLDRYIWEAEAHANELLDLLPLAERLDQLALIEEAGAQSRMLFLCQNSPKTAFVFLGEDPAARDRRMAKMSIQDRNVLFLQARYHALQAARAMRLAATVANVKGMKYRKAVRHAAEAVSQAPAPLSLRDILLLQLPD